MRKCNWQLNQTLLKGVKMREISQTGKEMLLFQAKLAEQYKYKPIPIDLFTGNIRDKYEKALPNPFKGEHDTEISLFSAAGTMISTGYNQIVIGDYGAFIEILPEQICPNSIICKKGQEYRYRDERYAKNIKYLWFTTKDSSDCKIYLQKKYVDYADYIPGMYYISPYEVFLTAE